MPSKKRTLNESIIDNNQINKKFKKIRHSRIKYELVFEKSKKEEKKRIDKVLQPLIENIEKKRVQEYEKSQKRLRMMFNIITNIRQKESKLIVDMYSENTQRLMSGSVLICLSEKYIPFDCLNNDGSLLEGIYKTHFVLDTEPLNESIKKLVLNIQEKFKTNIHFIQLKKLMIYFKTCKEQIKLFCLSKKKPK
jgi:hypothetical protein